MSYDPLNNNSGGTLSLRYNDNALVLSLRPPKDNILSIKVIGIEYAYSRLLRT
jgi:hypothetical protein